MCQATNDNPSYFVHPTSRTIPDDCGDAVAVLKSADSGGDDALAVGWKVTLGSYLACLNLASHHPSNNSKQRRVVATDIDLTVTMENAKATAYLEALLNKKLRVFTNDSRMFLGDFKCTDNVSRSSVKVWRGRRRGLIVIRNATSFLPSPLSIVTQPQALSKL